MRRSAIRSSSHPGWPQRLSRTLLAFAVALPLCASAATLKVGDQQLQTRGILEASGQLKDVPYKIEWFLSLIHI